MASVNRVYTALKRPGQQRSEGICISSCIHSFAGLAQMNIFNRLFDEHRNAMRFRRAGIDPGKKFRGQRLKNIDEDLSVFQKKQKVNSGKRSIL